MVPRSSQPAWQSSVKGGGGGGVGGGADFAEGAPSPLVLNRLFTLWRGSSRKNCARTPPPPLPGFWGGNHLLKPIQHAARVGGP